MTEVFPGSSAAFPSVIAGSGSVTVDPANVGIGMQSLTLVSASNAVVTIPSFPPGTYNPVTATFTVPNSGQAVDFTLRASARLSSVLIRAQCSAGAGPEQASLKGADKPVLLRGQAYGGLSPFALKPGEVRIDG